MASNEIRIPVSAEIQADHKSLLAVQKALENTLALAGKDTTFATNLRKSLAEIEPLIEKFGRIVMEPEIDKNALRELEHIAKKVFGTFDKTVEQGRFLDVSKMLSDEDLARIQEYTKQVAALGRELEKVRQHGAGGAASEWLAKPEVTKGSDVAARAAKSSTYKPAATLEQNVTSFTNAASAAAAKSADLAQRVVELTSAYETATKVTAQAQANLKTLEASVPAIQRRADTATFASAITRIKGTTSAAQNMQANTPIKEIGTTLHQFGDAGYIQASYRNLATRFFQALGMGVEQATSLAASQIDRDIVPALQRHFGIDETNMRSYVVDNGPMLSQLREAGAIFGEILRNELTQARAAGMGSDVEGITDYAKKKQDELASARLAVKKARTAENEAFEEWAGAEEAQKQAQDLNIELTSLATALREAAAAAKTLKEAQLKADQDAAKRGAADVEDKERERVMAPVKTHAPQAQKDEGAGDENRDKMGDLLRQGENAKAEANAFKASMQNAIKQWFSVQQIITIVKQGIRQAYQDIQGLDKAMTNIAVVTDMSISDLWGQINEYMSIAQQYGVTTQGVYEVSQLYYQQGLTTNEVMAATTETLKLARIAGMGYAEAADAMTVAIRSFKMEMSDAATVTDVYSKVAAITASDSEELAIAMSKTASSAESVGSSFENTTAMLAVMIETTRESAQNLGSALKSIISRYGEMKVGLTVDSEGEEIDYNKVDTALKSVGISIKDAQGQFRDFDDVIFELSSKWDSLDKNTQRYIATIMAGNRQQSRFIALVDNWERLDEVAGAAHNAEDAGLLQYAKTLDSLETKLNNIKTSFQQFYMSIFNGPVVGALLEGINKIIQGFNKLGNWQSLLNIVGFISSIKTLGGLLVNKLSSPLSDMYTKYKNHFDKIIQLAAKSGSEAGRVHAQNMSQTSGDTLNNNPQPSGGNQPIQPNQGATKTNWSNNSWGTTKNGISKGTIVSLIGSGIGLVGSTAGSFIAGLDIENARGIGATVSGVGNIGSGVAAGASFGPWGALAGGLISLLAVIPAVYEAFDNTAQLKDNLEKAAKESEEKKIKSAQAKDDYTSLKEGIDKVQQLEKNKDQSEEDYTAWAEANNALVEKYPQLFGYMDQYGNKIADLSTSSDTLKNAFQAMAQAAKDANQAEIDRLEAEIQLEEGTEYKGAGIDEYLANGAVAGVIGAGAGAASAIGIGAAIGTAAGPIGTAVGAVIGGIVGLVTGIGATVAHANEAIGKESEFVRNNITKSTSNNFTNKQLADYLTENNINLEELIRKGADGELTGDQQTLYEVLKSYKIIDENNKITESFSKYWTGYKELLETQQAALNEQNVALQVSIKALQTGIDDEFEELTGYSSIVMKMGLAKGYSMEDLVDLSLEQYQELITPFASFYNQLTSIQKEDFASLYENLLSFSFEELSNKLKELGLDESSAIYQAYMSQWAEGALESRQRLFNTVFADNFDTYLNPTEYGEKNVFRNGSLEIISYSEWWEKNKDKAEYANLTDAEKRQEYDKFLDTQLKFFYGKNEKNYSSEDPYLDELYRLIFDVDSGESKLSPEEEAALVSFAASQDDIISSDASIFAKQAAAARRNRLALLYGEMGVIDWSSSDWRTQLGEVGSKSGIDLASLGIDFSDWDKADAQAFQQLLVADNAGSLEWQEQMDALAAKYGQTIDWTNEALDSFLYTNFNTRITMLAEDIEGFIKELEDLGKKQSSGFSWEDSQKLLKQLGEGYSWTDLFEVNEQGLIVLKDFDKTVADLYNGKLDELKRLSGQVETALNAESWVDEENGTSGSTVLASLKFRHEMYTGEDSEGGAEITAAESEEWLGVLQSRFNIGEELGQQLIDMIIGNVEMTETEYTEFLEELAQQNAELAKYFEKQKELVQANTAFDYYFSENFNAANTAKTAASNYSLSTIKDAAIASGAITGQAVYKKDENGNVVNDKGKAVVDYYDYDWATFFDNFEGISIDSYGEILITDPAAYAESLIETLGETDQKVINDIYQSVFEQYHTQWQQRQSELETLFADYQFTDQEVAKMFAWAVANGQADADISMEEFAAQWGLEEVDGVWEATSADTYYKMLTYAAAENPDLDFSDLPSWEEWAVQKAQDAITRKNEAVKFLKELSIKTGPEELEKAIDLGLLDVTKISEADLAAFEAGDKTVYDLIAAQRPQGGFEDPELEAAWKVGQENYNQEVSKWLNDLFNKATLTPAELLEIWELLGAPEGDFDTWAEQGFEYDPKAGNYRVTASSYGVYAQAAAAKDATEMPSRLDFLQTLHTGEKTQTDARTQALSSLSIDATIHDLDAVYQAGLITDEQYLQAIADAAAGRKTYYESIIGFVDRSNKEVDDAVQEIEAKQITSMQVDIDSLFGDTTLDNDSIKKMWLDAETDKDMFSWAEEALGVVYENGKWVIKNASQAWATMSEWFKEEYGEDNYAQYMTPEKQQEFQSMWANYQDVQSDSIISFIEGLSPESGEDILSEAVELGLTTWEEIATYKSQGYNAYDTIRAIAEKEGSTWTKEQKAALEEGWKTYQRETASAVTDFFEDGLFSEEDMEKIWIASGSDLSFDDWMARTLQVDGTQVSFFEKVGDGWVIKSRQAYDEMVQWVADTYGAEFVALLPSYDKLQAMGGLEEARQKENKLDYLTGLTPEMGVEDLEKAVELGIITEDEMAYIIAADVNYWDAISAAVNRMDAEYQQAFAESRAKYFDSLIGEADSYTKDTSWTTEQLTKRFGGSTDWMETGDFVLDLETGEWEAKNKEAYEALKDWVKSEYGEAYANLLPTWEDFEGQQIFEDGIKKTSDKVDIIKGLSYDFSLDDLEKLVEAGMLTYQEATAIWSSANPWETLLSTIKLSSQEELDAFNQMVTENNIAMGEAALALFNDSSLTWDEVSTLWANQLGEGGETDIVKWAQSMGLEFIDGEWKITTEEAYNNMVAAAKELYGEAWAAMVPSKEDILAANLLDKQITRDSKVDFIEGLNFEEITASDMQKAIEQGIITSEQLMWAQENGIDYQTLIGMAISHDQEMVQAFNEGLVEYNLAQRENMMTLFDDNVLSQEQVIQMWHDMGSGQTFDSWLAGSGIEFIDGEFRIDSAAAFNTVKEWAKTYWGDAWDSIPWSTITAEQWEAGMANIKAMETDAAIESFFSDFDTDAGMDEAYKAVELGILTQEQLLHGLAQGFSVWDVVTSYALESTENYSDFIDMINNRTRAEYLSSAFSLGTADSWSSDQIISLWDLNGRTENSNFIDWAQDNGFIINENGQWEASTKEAYQSMLDYIEVTFGAAYANALPTADEWEAANLLEKAETDSDRTDFIKGLTADADVAEILQQAIDYGILDLNDYINEEGKLELPSREQLFADIGANLHTQEDVDAFNEAMLLIEQDRIETVSSLMKDNSFTGTELYKIWKKTAQTGVSFSDWLSDAGFVLQKDGTYKAMGEAAYDVMVSYVRDNFGEAFVALLPTKEDWENSKLLEDFHSEMDMGEFLSGLDVNATIDDLDKAAELFGITYTEEQLNAIKEGSKTVYEVILESLAPKGWVDGVFGRTGPMADVVNEIERMNRDALIAELPFGELLTTAEGFTSAAQTLAALGFDEGSYKEILADGRIGLEETIAILEESQYYLDAVIVNDEGEAENAGEALFAAAQAYGLSLDSFFEMEVYSPALILERLGLQLDQLTAEQYDSFKTAQSNYAESVSKLFSGTGSAADMKKLLATINYGRDADKQWDYSAFYETAKGIQLDRSKFFEALSILKEQDWELYSSIRETLVSSPELLGENFDSIMEVQQAINELGLEHINLLEEQNAALREQASIYGEIYAQMSMNKSEGWDFLNAELHGNAQNFMSWGKSVRGTFEQLGNKDGIEPMAFINMLNYMQQMGTTVETLGGNFASWGELMTSAYSAFGKAIVTGTNVTVDDLGISTENMTSAMFESMQKTARQQVDFLDGQIAMLEGIKAISDIDEGELSIGSIYQTMADEVSKYNAETGSDIKLDNIFITVGGERFSFTEEGIAKAEEKYNTLFADSGISFEHALQTSLGNNFGVVMEGGTIGITPTGVMEVELSVDGAAITDSLSETNGYLTNINSSLITIVGLLSTGKNPWTAEGAAAYFTDEEGNSVIPQTPEELREWYANLDPISQAIYRNYEKTSGIPFEYSPIASADGYQEGEYGKNIYTITTADGEKITGQQVIIETIDGKATPTYATGLDESGKGITYRAIPETWLERAGAVHGIIGQTEGLTPNEQTELHNAVSRLGYYENRDGTWYYKGTENKVLQDSADWTVIQKSLATLDPIVAAFNSSPWAQATYYTMTGQPEKVPGYGVSGKGYTTPGPSTPVNVNTLLEKTNSELDQVVANTAETNALLAAMQGNLDLSTKEGAQTYLKTYRNFNEQWQTDSEGFKTWWQGASETDRKLWRQFYSNPETAAQAANWGSSTNEAVIVAVDWEENGLPEDDIVDIQEFWIGSYGTEEVPFSEEWEQYRQQVQVSPEDGNYAYYQNGNYIIDEDGYVWERNASGDKGAAVRDNTEWDWDRLFQSPEFLSWLSGTEIGRQYYTENTSTPAPQTRVLTEGEKTTRENWFNSLTPAEQGNFLTSLGYTGIEYTYDANGITGISSYGTAAQTGTPGAVNFDAILANSGFEKQYAIAIGGIFDKFYEGINQYRDLAAKAVELDGYEKRGDNWYKKGETTAVDVDTATRLNEYQTALGENNINLTNLGNQLAAWAGYLGIQFDPNLWYEAGADTLTNDAILRTSKTVEDAMAKLSQAIDDSSQFFNLLEQANLNPTIGNVDLSTAKEMVAQGYMTQKQLDDMLLGVAQAWATEDSTTINTAETSFNDSVIEAQIAKLNDEKATLENTVATLQGERDALASQAATLQGSVDALTETRDTTLAKLQTSQENIGRLRSDVDTIGAQLVTKTAELDEATTARTTAEANYNTVNGQAIEARANANAAWEEVEAMIAAYGEDSPEARAARAKAAEAEKLAALKQAEAEAAQKALLETQELERTLRGEVADLTQQYSEATQALREEEIRYGTLLNDLQVIEGLLNDKEAELTQVRETLSDAEARLKEANETIGERDETIKQKDAIIKELTDQLNNPEKTQTENVADASNAADYWRAQVYLEEGRYEEAIALFEGLEDYEDSQEKVLETRYAWANSLVENGNYDEAAEIFQSLGEYKDSGDRTQYSRYKSAQQLVANGQYSEAAEIFQSLGDYKDSANQFVEASRAQARKLKGIGDLEGAIEIFESLGDLTEVLRIRRQADEALTPYSNAYLGLKPNNDGFLFVNGTSEGGDQLNVPGARYLGGIGRVGDTYTYRSSVQGRVASFEDTEDGSITAELEFNENTDEAFLNWIRNLTLSNKEAGLSYVNPQNIGWIFEKFLNYEEMVEYTGMSLDTPGVSAEWNGVNFEFSFDKDIYDQANNSGDISYTLYKLWESGEKDAKDFALATKGFYENLAPEIRSMFGKAFNTLYNNAFDHENFDENQMQTFEKLFSVLPGIESSRHLLSSQGQEQLNSFYANIESGNWAGTLDNLNAMMSELEQVAGFDLTYFNEAKNATESLSASTSETSAGMRGVGDAAEYAAARLKQIPTGGGGGRKDIMTTAWGDGSDAFALGNVSGLALADGNSSLDRLNIGARLAGKTLVGELGPELAVYDGMYHLLGQNGAEFVDLPSNAIVFNHRQTAGIVRGQIGYRGKALAEGNVDDLIAGEAFAEGHITGPARAGIDQTIGQLKSLRAMWQNILDMDASQLAQAGGGGGGGNSLKATTADLEEWYNLMRQIEQIEQEITNLEAKRANIYDGSDYLKNLRETQKLLEKQRLTQQRLYEYQRKQLQAQADFINQHEIWNKFLTVGEDGLLQYIKGNEQVGGKGTIEVLSKLNEMSGAEQEKFVKSLGYTAKDEEGKALEGEKLVARFYEELQDQIDQYKELYETVHTTEAELEDLTSQIEDINREVVENQKELETNIYDIIVDAWEKEIGLLEEQAKLVEEANKAYTDGLKKALGAERDLYEENKSTEERESLQRQLALLRRSGGSAAEIADLEEQLDDALKDEYFKTQEKMIENIEDANERQVKKLEEQITLQKEALEYEKDNGIIWTKVYDVLRGSQESILAFMQGNSTEQFFSKSALEQEEMLLDWAKKIGIYSEDQQSKTAMAEAEKHWNSEAMWSGEVLSGLQGNYENLSDEQKAYMAEYFKKSYSDARLDGSTEAEAQRIAEENIKTYLTEGGTGTGIEDMGGGSGGGDLTHWVFKFNGQDYTHYATQATATKKIDELYKSALDNLPSKQDIPVPITAEDTAETIREKREKAYMERVLAVKKLRTDAISSLKYGSHAKGYSKGGLVDYTGLAMVHGSKSKPESFLNAAQTAQIKEALQATHGKENLLEGLHSTIAELRSLIHNISTINNSTNYEVSIAPGAVVINVDELANSYDVEELSADIMNRMAAIASKATNRGVNRR